MAKWLSWDLDAELPPFKVHAPSPDGEGWDPQETMYHVPFIPGETGGEKRQKTCFPFFFFTHR